MSAILYSTKRICAYLNNNGLRQAAVQRGEAYPSGWNLTERQVGYMLERRLLPAFKVGSIWASTPEMLTAHFEALARGGCNQSEASGGD